MGDSADWFRFELSEVGSVASHVSIAFTHARGDLDMALFNSSGVELNRSAGSVNFERVALTDLPPGTYYAKVYGFLGVANPSYTLTVNPAPWDEASPLDKDARGGDYSLTGGPSFNLGTMQLSATRTVGNITFRFYNDKPTVTTWTTAEINVMMQAVNEMDAWTDNNRQLLIDPFYGNQHNFVKTDQARLIQFLGNGNWWGLNRNQGTNRAIAFIDWNENSTSSNAEQIRRVKHEPRPQLRQLQRQVRRPRPAPSGPRARYHRGSRVPPLAVDRAERLGPRQRLRTQRRR